MINNKLVQNYTSALFDNAIKNALEDKILEHIKVINTLIQNNQKVKDTLLSPIAKYSDKLEIVELIAKNLDTQSIVKQFLLILLKHSRISILPNIIVLYQELLNKKRHIKIVKVTSSKLLQTEGKSWLQRYLEDILQQQVAINFEHDPTIIGGIIIQYDNIVQDYSLAGALKKINKTLKERII